MCVCVNTDERTSNRTCANELSTVSTSQSANTHADMNGDGWQFVGAVEDVGYEGREDVPVNGSVAATGTTGQVEHSLLKGCARQRRGHRRRRRWHRQASRGAVEL